MHKILALLSAVLVITAWVVGGWLMPVLAFAGVACAAVAIGMSPARKGGQR